MCRKIQLYVQFLFGFIFNFHPLGVHQVYHSCYLINKSSRVSAFGWHVQCTHLYSQIRSIRFEKKKKIPRSEIRDYLAQIDLFMTLGGLKRLQLILRSRFLFFLDFFFKVFAFGYNITDSFEVTFSEEQTGYNNFHILVCLESSAFLCLCPFRLYIQ